MTFSFEQGPIRPPVKPGASFCDSPAIARGTSALFCPVYKRAKFSRRSIGEIHKDIDAVAAIVDDLKKLSFEMGFAGEMNRHVLTAVLTNPGYEDCYRHVALWHTVGNGTVFLQDANNLMLSSSFLVDALTYLKSRVPGIRRVTSYARGSTLARKSVAELKELRDAGLDRIHVGMESGSDRVLESVKKGVTARQLIEGGRKTIEAGISLSEYVMPGLGGTALSTEHAVHTARVLNAVDPHFIRLRSLRIPSRAPLYKERAAGRFLPLSDDDTVREIRLFIESLEGIHSTLASDHIMNLLQEVEGTFPQDKPAMLAVIDQYLALPPGEKTLYRLGRRGGALDSLEKFRNPAVKSRLERARDELQAETGTDIEAIITEMGDQYI